MVAVLNPVKGGRPVIVDKAVVLIGRHPDCDCVLTDSRKVSRRHCCVVQVNDRYMVRDLGSMNGLWINGDRVEREATLGIGDELSVGDVVFRFEDVQRLPAQPNQGLELEDAADGNADQAAPPIVNAQQDVELSQKYPVPIPDQDQSFEVLETIEADDLPLPPNDEFVPILDVEETFDEEEIKPVVLLDEDADLRDDDDVVILDED